MRGSQGIANLYIAVADGENLTFAVDIGHLMHEAVILGFFQDGHRLVIGDKVSTVGLHQIFGHIAYPDTPVTVVVGAAFFQLLAAIAA